MPPAIPSTELFLMVLATDYLGRTAVRTGIFALFDGLHPFETLQPDFAAIQTPYGTNIARKGPALDCDGLAVDQAIGDFFPGGT